MARDSPKVDARVRIGERVHLPSGGDLLAVGFQGGGRVSDGVAADGPSQLPATALRRSVRRARLPRRRHIPPPTRRTQSMDPVCCFSLVLVVVAHFNWIIHISYHRST